MDVILAAASPLTAYGIVAEARRRGAMLSPVQVYRCLDRMIAENRVARLVTIKSYVPASAAEDGYCICRQCGTVASFDGQTLSEPLKQHARSRGFTVSCVYVELPGLCEKCAGGQRSRV